MSYTLPPMLDALTLPRPASAERTREHVESAVTLAGGSERTYVTGWRYVYSLSWERLTEAQVVAIEAAASPFVGHSYRHVDGTLASVRVSGPPSVRAVRATDPVLHALTLELREPQVRNT